jgi:hypothetical protein
MTLNGNTLLGVLIGATTLRPITDYTVAGNIVTIKKEYLATLAVGSQTILFDFSAGTDRELVVTVSDTTVVQSSAKAITAFTVPGQTGASTIDATARTVAITVPNGTNVTTLVATFTLSASASAAISSTGQVSGTTANDFTTSKTYVVTAENGTTNNWVVTITVAPADTTAPVLSGTSVTGVTTTTATLNFTTSEAGTYYFLVLAASAPTPIASAIKAQGTAVAKGSDATLAIAKSASITGLSASTSYKAWVVVEDAAGNISLVAASSEFTTDAISSGGGGGGGGGGGSAPVSLGFQTALTVVPAVTTVQLTKTTSLSTTGGSGTGALTYATSTPTICSVTSTGVVTAIAAGNCLVTATKAASTTHFAATSTVVTIVISDSDQKGAEADAAAKAAADKAAADKAAADKAAADKAAADKAAADKAAADKAAADKAAADAKAKADAEEAARLAAIEKAKFANTVTYSIAGRTKVVTANLSVTYGSKSATLEIGTKVKGKIVYKRATSIVLNKNGDGTFRTTSTIKAGNYIRVLVGKTVVKTTYIK